MAMYLLVNVITTEPTLGRTKKTEEGPAKPALFGSFLVKIASYGRRWPLTMFEKVSTITTKSGNSPDGGKP
jgi:hypothetical protein